MLKKYFNILDLPENATANEVRKQYRKLVMRYHPDKNPSQEAKHKFLQITEAYEILIGKKEVPASSHITKSKDKSAEERVREARKRYNEQLKKEKEENDRYFKNLLRGRKWRIIKFSAVIGTLLAIAVIFDLVLPNHYEKDRLTHYSSEIYSGGRGIEISLVKTAQNQKFWVADIDYAFYGQNQNILIQRSWIFHDPINLVSIHKTEYKLYSVYYTFYSISIVLILLFLLPLMTVYFKRQTVMFTVMYYISLYVSCGMILVFILTNDRWAHLLSFGFL